MYVLVSIRVVMCADSWPHIIQKEFEDHSGHTLYRTFLAGQMITVLYVCIAHGRFSNYCTIYNKNIWT